MLTFGVLGGVLDKADPLENQFLKKKKKAKLFMFHFKLVCL